MSDNRIIRPISVRNGIRFEAIKAIDLLPEVCFAVNPSEEDLPEAEQNILLVKRGEQGFWKSGDKGGWSAAMALNERLGVTRGQAEAMLIGSMCGYDCPGADPTNYHDDGSLRHK